MLRAAADGTRMPSPLETQIIDLLRRPKSPALKPKAMARALELPADQYPAVKAAVRELLKSGQAILDGAKRVRLAKAGGALVGSFKALRAGGGIVRIPGGTTEVRIRPGREGDAATGDTVRVTLRRPAREGMAAEGMVAEVVRRAAHTFVGVVSERLGERFVQADGNSFREPLYLADGNVKGAKPGEMVAFEVLRYPSARQFGEAVVTEVLGDRADPDVDLKATLAQFELPDAFDEAALAEARTAAEQFNEAALPDGRLDLTAECAVTIDPPTAQDFDDAIAVVRDDRGHWRLTVHIADVVHFVRPNTHLDREARRRGTSVYLPGKTLPMLPALISNGLASLQQGRVRYVKTVVIDFDPSGAPTHTAFANAAIRVRRRLAYEQVSEFFADPAAAAAAHPDRFPPEVAALLHDAKALYELLRQRRRDRGMLELNMPAPELDFDDRGLVAGAHFAAHDASHELVEEFMLTANEAVAARLAKAGTPFLRRVHPPPDPLRLATFGSFARSLGYPAADYTDRFALRRLLAESKDDPRGPALHYAALRSFREAVYSPEPEGHYALASADYCHFTSPIRRYPDLLVHRLVDRFIRHGKGGDEADLVSLGEHCSFTERRAAKAERELVKLKLLRHAATRLGETVTMVVTGVEDFGLFALGVAVPMEGLLHVRALPPDDYSYDRNAHVLQGRRAGNTFRLGDRLECVLHRVDLANRTLDLRLVGRPTSPAGPGSPPPPRSPRPVPAKTRLGKKPKLPKGKGKRKR